MHLGGRDLARGIHPAILTNRGLAAALSDLGSRSPVPVEIRAVPDERLPDPVEAAIYFIVSESLANVAKHSEASAASVSVSAADGWAGVEVADDGIGGVTAGGGSGLQGLSDRAAALDGTLSIESPAGAGTRVQARLPLAGAAPPAARGPVVLTDEAAAERRARSAQRLKAHAAVATSVLATLVVIWGLTTAGYFWPAWPIAAWGLLLAIHAWLALGRRPLTEEAVAAGQGGRADTIRALTRRRGFTTRAALSALLAAFLVSIWALAGGSYFWPAWAMLGLGLVLAADLAQVKARGGFKTRSTTPPSTR